MNKKEIKRAFESARNDLIDATEKNKNYIATCAVIVNNFPAKYYTRFNALFKPGLRFINSRPYYFGARSKRNLQKRLIALDLFEQYVLTEGI